MMRYPLYILTIVLLAVFPGLAGAESADPQTAPEHSHHFRTAACPDAPDSTQAGIIPFIGAELFGIDRAHSQLDFIIRFLGLTDVRGNFSEYTAAILYDEEDMTNTSITLSIDARTIDTQNDWRDNDLRSERFFDTTNHPYIVFQSDRIVRDGGGYVAHGELTMKGITRNVAVPFQHMLRRTADAAWGNVRIGFKGALTLNRTDFNIHGGDFWGVMALSKEVRIEFALLGTRRNLERVSYSSQEKPSIGKVVEPIIQEEGLDAAIRTYRRLKRDAPDGYNFAEGQLNLLGYRLLRRGRLKEALAILKLNAEVHPDSPNVYDSLGEVYATMGDVENAVAYYQKALELAPQKVTAAEMLRRLSTAIE